MAGNPSFTKRQKERARQEKQAEKAQKRAQRKLQKETGAAEPRGNPPAGGEELDQSEGLDFHDF
jgi:hypothetical protein